MKKLISCFIIFLLIATSESLGQQDFESTVQKSIQTPTVSSLGEYGDIPVNLYTGTPNISISLYTFGTSIVNLPISLSYHASGVRVDDEAGIVGLGWSLNAGGVITRTVQGFPDDTYNNKAANEDVINTYQKNISNAWVTAEQVLKGYELSTMSTPDSLRDIIYLLEFPNNRTYEYDTKPDIFTFNFAGKTGKFLLPNNFDNKSSGTLPLLPYQNLTITWYKEQNVRQALEKFVITEVDGTTYFFEKIEETTTYSARYDETDGYKWVSDPSQYEQYNSSWFLTRIESPVSQEVIQFNYITHNKERKTPGSATVLQSEAGQNTFFASKQRSLFNSYLLDQIITEKEIVQFNYNNEDFLQPSLGIILNNKTLHDIEIKLADGTSIKKWKLDYNYFKSENDAQPQLGVLSAVPRQAKLVSVQESDPSGNTAVPPFKMEYLNDSSHRLPLDFDIYGYTDDNDWQKYFENAAVDYWGYYNGKTINNRFDEHDTERVRIPDIGSRIFDLPSWYYVDMEPDENYILNGIISKITYPTGGFTEFDFEIHDYSWIEDKNLYDVLPETDINPNPSFSVGNTEDNGSVNFRVEQNSIGENFNFTIRLHNPSQLEPNEGHGTVTLKRISPNPATIATLGATVEPGSISASASTDSLVLAAGTYTLENKLTLGSPDIYGLDSKIVFTEPVEVSENGGSLGYEIFTVEQITQDLGNIRPRVAPDLIDYKNKKGGGVRIKRITSYPDTSDSNPVVKRFEYKESDENGVPSARSSGVLVRPTQYLQQTSVCNLDLDYCILVQRLESNSFLPLGTTHGSNVGYREVTELLGENGEFGKIRHVYSSPVEVPDIFKKIFARTFYLKHNIVFSQDWARGNEIQTEYYSETGLKKYAVERDYELNVLSNRNNMYPGVEVRSLVSEVIGECVGSEDICFQDFEVNYATVTVNTTGRSNLVKETETFFDDTGAQKMETAKHYTYLEPFPNVSLPRKVTEVNSDSTKRIIRNLYAHEVADDGTGIDYRPMQNLDMLSQPYAITVTDSANQVLRKSWTLWSDSTGYWRPRGVWKWKEGDNTNPLFNYEN